MMKMAGLIIVKKLATLRGRHPKRTIVGVACHFARVDGSKKIPRQLTI